MVWHTLTFLGFVSGWIGARSYRTENRALRRTITRLRAERDQARWEARS